MDDFEYELPHELIAQQPTKKRDLARLMVIDRATGTVEDRLFSDIVEYLTPQDVMVINESKVIPARIFGRKKTGGKVEILLAEELQKFTWKVLSKPGLKKGQKIFFDETLSSEALDSNNDDGTVTLRFHYVDNFWEKLDSLGRMPIPPYIESPLSEERLKKEYQTVYATYPGSVAAPTAGLHFTEDLLKRLKDKGVSIIPVRLNVGMGTFAPLQEKNILEKKLHTEKYFIDPISTDLLNSAISTGKRIIAMGTTTIRTLESAYDGKKFVAGENSTDIFIMPPYQFKTVSGLVTNFHLPKSSLLMLVTAFLSEPNNTVKFTSFKSSWMKKIYMRAIEKRYRFFSFGDAMLIL